MTDEVCIMLCEAIIERALKDLHSQKPKIRGDAKAFLKSEFCAFMLGCKLDFNDDSTIIIKETY